MSEYNQKVGTTEVTIKADFSESSDEIYIRYADCGDRDAEFETTGKQVADFRHDPDAALEYFCAKME